MDIAELHENPHSLRNQIARTAWKLCSNLLYRPSPRPAHKFRIALLRIFGAKVDWNAYPYPKCKIWLPSNLTMGAHSCLSDDVDCYNVAPVILEPLATVSQYSYLCSASHDINDVRFPLFSKPIRIGTRAWVAARCYIGPGVTLSEGAVAGANSCVYRDVPAWTVVGGNPARPIAKRTETVLAALRVALLLAAILTVPKQGKAESAIFWTSGPVRAGETVLVTGHFPKPETISIRVGDATVKPIKATGSSVEFILPSGSSGIVPFRIEEENESPIFGVVNRPEVWWTISESPISAPSIKADIETNETAPGATLRLFGRCLAKEKGNSQLELTSSSGRTVVLEASVESPYAIKAQIPSNIAPGKYALRVRTDSATPDLESVARALEVHPAKSISLKSLSVDDFGAIGNGSFDNSKAFGAALAKAATLGGAEIKIPKGAFWLSQPLLIPVGVYLSGESADSTMLAFPDVDAPPDSWVKGSQYFGLRQLSIYCGNHNAIISSDMSGNPDKAGHVRIYDVRVVGSDFRGHLERSSPDMYGQRLTRLLKADGHGSETLRLSGPDLVVENSFLLGSGKSLFLLRASGALIRHNRIVVGIWYNFDLSEEIINQDNVFEGAVPLGVGGSYSTFETDPSAPRQSQNIYTANNSYSNMLGQDREAFTSDGGQGPYVGGVEKTDGKVLDLKQSGDWRNINWQGAAVVIVTGRGAGQWRRLSSWKNQQIVISAPFEIAPDATSTVTIVPTQLHYVFYRNHFDEAGVAIQFWGSSIEHIAAENEATRAGGFQICAINYQGSQPVLNTQLLGNEIRPGLNYHYGLGKLAGGSALLIRAERRAVIFGLVVRGNKLAAPAQLVVDGEGVKSAMLIERNDVLAR